MRWHRLNGEWHCNGTTKPLRLKRKLLQPVVAIMCFTTLTLIGLSSIEQIGSAFGITTCVIAFFSTLALCFELVDTYRIICGYNMKVLTMVRRNQENVVERNNE